jgi:hypothetical protein
LRVNAIILAVAAAAAIVAISLAHSRLLPREGG